MSGGFGLFDRFKTRVENFIARPSDAVMRAHNFFAPKPAELSLRESIAQSNKGTFQNLKDRISAFAHGRYNAPPAVVKFLKDYGAYNVDSIVVCRKPVIRAIQHILNALTLGKYEREKKKLGYDDLYHLYLQMSISNPTNGHSIQITAEKNHVVQIHSSHGECPESVTVGSPNTTVFEFFERGSELQGNSFWQYDPIQNNCQVFSKTLLEANHILTPEAEAFVFQPAKTLLSEEAHKFSSGVTDIAGRLDALVMGAGLRSHAYGLTR